MGVGREWRLRISRLLWKQNSVQHQQNSYFHDEISIIIGAVYKTIIAVFAYLSLGVRLSETVCVCLPLSRSKTERDCVCLPTSLSE